MLYGAPRPQNGDSSIVFVPGSNWSIPLYSCVTATKAIVKTVKFQFNGSDDLSGLTVTGLTEKKYSNQSSKPLWGVEVTNQELVNTSPLWGLVSSPDQGNISLSTLRKESLYLPGNLGSYSQMAAVADNVPGTSFHTQALLEAYQIGDSQQKADYSGKSNMALFRLWQNYSSDPANAARILNVVWTDWAANTVVGSRGIHTNGSATLHKRSSTSQDLYPVINYHRRIRYHLPYAIPAIVALFFAALILVGTVVACFGDSGPRKMKRFLMKTSPARILTARLYGSSSPQPPTYTSSGITSILSRGKQWQDTTGRKDISLSQQQPDNVVIHDSKFAERTEPLLYDGMHLTPM